MDIYKPATDEPINFRVLAASESFIQNFQLELIAGTGLPLTTDSVNRYIVVNETAVKALGYQNTADVIGEVLIQTWNKEPLEVVGVVKDFWLKPPVAGDKMEPAFLQKNTGKFSYANIKIISGNIPGTLEKLGAQWKLLDPDHPFKFEFHEEALASTADGVFDLVSIVGFLAFIAITIACLGMLGMATYTSERKKKEVGIRKVLGADAFNIAFMLSKDFLVILVIAIFIGAPMSYFINNLWLQKFANRADFGIGTVLIGAFVLAMLGVFTIGSQTIRVSKSNPVDSLKME
jgi:putative ABC transport system permease protein